jgi:hypothetical protein
MRELCAENRLTLPPADSAEDDWHHTGQRDTAGIGNRKPNEVQPTAKEPRIDRA